MAIKIELKGAKEFERALKRNPSIVEKEAKNYFTRAMAVLKQTALRNPWRVGGSGGGVPVDTGNLFIAHETEINKFSAKLFVNNDRAKYASYVHDGTSRMKARPWLEYSKEKNKKAIERLQDDLLKNIVKDLAR